MDVKKLLGNNVKKYRKKMGLSQEELSEKLNISQNHLSSIEIGKRFASSKLIDKLSKVLSVSPAALFFKENSVKSDDSIKALTKVIDKELKTAKKEIIKKIIEM